MAVAVSLGGLLGLGAFTFAYADGASYLTDDPDACINCHVMQENYDAWLNSSHASVAVCNDCHAAPHNVVAKYWSKGVNGLAHSWAFTSGRFPEHIVITSYNRGIAESACRECHSPIVHTIATVASGSERLECIRCHASVGHGP